MAVKPGYKQTELGIIPEEWEVRAFGENYAETSRNGIYKSAEFQGRGTRIVNMGEMFGFDFISNQEMSRVDLTDKEVATTGLHDGDLLFGRRSVVPAGAGKCSIVVEPSEPLTFESSIIRVRLRQSDANPLFHYYFFASSAGRGVMSSIIAGTNVKGIRGSELRELKIPRPSYPEQSAIATALSDIDALLDALKQLIAKKRDLKQAAMQQLLTGQTRLPDFSGDWLPSTLGEVATFLSGGTPARSNDAYWNGDIPWISATSLRCSEIWRSDSNVTEEAVAAGSKIAPIGSTLLLVRGSALHKEILCGLVTKRVCFNQDVKALVPHAKVFPKFLTTLIKGMANDFLKLVSSAGNTAGVLDTKLLKAFEFLLPSLPEQTAIATVLSDMDAELAALEQRLTKTRELKQGMMQELLTGRTRLL